MELSLEQKKELSQLSGYFKKLEITANHLGIDLDEFITEYRDNGYAVEITEEMALKTTQRKETFQKAGKKPEKAKVAHPKG